MKVFIKGFMLALLIGALASVSAFAGGKDKTRKANVTFATDVMVNGTLLKSGDYQVKFDEETNELSILRNGKVKAKTNASLATRGEKARQTAVRTLTKGEVAELIGVAFAGSNQEVVVGANTGAVTGN